MLSCLFNLLFFEHLPINQEWITKQFRINPLTSEGGSDPEPTDKVILAFEEYIFSGKFIDSKVFGEVFTFNHI